MAKEPRRPKAKATEQAPAPKKKTAVAPSGRNAPAERKPEPGALVQGSAITRYAKMSAKKANRILMLIRNRDVPDALNTLLFLNKPSKTPILKTLKSAVANAVLKAGRAKLKEEELRVEEARADGGPMLKRYQAGSHGRAMMIRRRTTHITVKVIQREA